jgi:tetratricopeptide (TPR) repeat protein
MNPQTVGGKGPSGWALAVDRAPQFLSILALFFLPLLAQVRAADTVLVKRVLMEILLPWILAFWLLRTVLAGRWTLLSAPAHAVGALLLLWCAVTAHLSPYSAASWHALRDWLWVPLWFLLLTQTCHELWRAENLLVTFLTGALVASLWGIAQALGWGGREWQEAVRLQFAGRVVSGMGRPEYLAGFLLLVWPVALALLSRARSVFAKSYWGLVLVASFTCLLLTRSEPGWTGAVAGVLVFAMFQWRDRVAFGRGWAILGAVLLLLLVSVFTGPMAAGLQRLRLPGNDTVEHQSLLRRGAWNILADRPLTGSGFGTFRAAFPAKAPRELSMRQVKRMNHIPRAQNGLLEWWSETGTVGLSLLLAFWAAVAWPWWKLFRGHAIPPPLGAAFFAALAGSAVANLSSTDHAQPSTLVPLLLLAALSGPLSQRFLDLPGYPVRRRDGTVGPWRWAVAFAALAALAVAVAGTRVGLNRAWASVELRQGWIIAGPGEWDRAIAHYERAMRLDPSDTDIPYFLGVALNERGRSEEIGRALELMERTASREPDYMLIHVQKSKALDKLYREEEAAGEMRRAIELEPLLITTRVDYLAARTAMSSGRHREALDAYDRLLRVHPENPLLWMDLGNLRASSKDLPGALEALRRALALNPGYVDALRSLARIAADAGRLEEARGAVSALRRKFPGQPWVDLYAREIGLPPEGAVP